MFQYIYSAPPYANILANAPRAHLKICREISKKVPPAIRPNNLNPKLSDLWGTFEACWDSQPENRPTAKDVYNFLTEKGQAIIEAITETENMS